MCFIVDKSKPFKSAILKHKLSVFDKSDPQHLKFPDFIENIKNETLIDLIPTLINKYRKFDYKEFNREELDDKKDWNDLEVLLLSKFYKNQWSFIIIDEKNFFPSFVFTYNIEPLKKEVDKIVAHIYDKLEIDTSKEELQNRYTYSTLEITYLLHYFALTHPDYIEDES